MIKQSESVLIDVRSPCEYELGHIPRAVSIPLFNDEERHKVGLTYKQKGKEAAIAMGLELTSPKFNSYVNQLRIHYSEQSEIQVYCWRGGMRSASMCWLFNQHGFKAKTIVGGYKAWRRLIRSEFESDRKLFVLSGLTGCAKTEVLHELQLLGESVIDLEGLANHRGSAFGSRGKQPSNEHFHNLLGNELMKLDPTKPTWIEDESKNVGSVRIPDEFKVLMNKSVLVDIVKDVDDRVEFLCNSYGLEMRSDLINGFRRISKKMGGQHAKAAIKALQNNDLKTACKLALTYYDRTYQFSRNRSNRKPNHIEDSNGLTPKQTAEKLLEWKNQNLLS